MSNVLIPAFSASLMIILADLIPVRYKKVGGIHFLRIGRMQMMYCKCRFDAK